MSDGSDQIDRLEASVHTAGSAAAVWLEERAEARGARKAPARSRLHLTRSRESVNRSIAQDGAESQEALSDALHRDLEA
jgi:hypothetical protein